MDEVTMWRRVPVHGAAWVGQLSLDGMVRCMARVEDTGSPWADILQVLAELEDLRPSQARGRVVMDDKGGSHDHSGGLGDGTTEGAP